MDFILFALTLLGVAVFHHHTLAVGLTGLVVITGYKILVTGFKTGAGVAGFALHLQHEGLPESRWQICFRKPSRWGCGCATAGMWRWRT